MNFQRLARNIEQTIYEGMVKIGFLEDRGSQVYYDVKLLGFLLEEDLLDIQSAVPILEDFEEYLQKDLMDIEVRVEKERFCFVIGKKAMKEIYQRNKKDPFLRNLVQVMGSRQGTLPEVISVFEDTGLDYVVEEVDNPEFSHIFSFKDKNYDEHFYCFYFDQMGSYYHRLLAFELVNE